LEGFEKRVNAVHSESLKGQATLSAEIQKVATLGLQMSEEAQSLTRALKGDKKLAGQWGEAQLERTLQLAGLVAEDHYQAQAAFKDAAGKNKLPDFVINLPDGKHMVIDSKVSLVAYDQALSATEATVRDRAMQDHVRAVKAHIDNLSGKDYASLPGMESPDFVLMFMPIEAAYIEALKTDRNLFDHGYGRGVILVSHTTLLPILRTVANLWTIQHSHEEARAISEKAGDIYKQVSLVAERVLKLGGTLGTVANHYNSVVRAVSGQQGLYSKVERFRQLSAKAATPLPSIEPLHIDLEREKLAIMVEQEAESQDLEA
jgi:DNA recombination protein RmuC